MKSFSIYKIDRINNEKTEDLHVKCILDIRNHMDSTTVQEGILASICQTLSSQFTIHVAEKQHLKLLFLRIKPLLSSKHG